MKKLFVSILLTIILIPSFLSAQTATRQAGIRAGHRSGIFYQVTNEAGNAEIGYQAMLGYNDNGIQLTGLRIVYEMALSEFSPDLFFAWGYGGHVGFIYTDHVGFLGEKYNFQGERFCTLLGVDGWLSAEYRFRNIPLNISLNVQPVVELTIPSFVKIMPVNLGISVSYVF
jgi:hypothetical protein